MEETRKKSVFGGFVKLIVVLGAVYAGIVAAGKLVAKKMQQLEKKNVGNKEKKYLSVMNGQVIKISKEPVEEISIQAYLGGVTLDLTEALLEKETEVTIRGLMSGVVVKVPPMVRVVLDGTNILSGFANMVPNYEAEDLPTVYVYAESVMSGIAAQMEPDVEKDA